MSEKPKVIVSGMKNSCGVHWEQKTTGQKRKQKRLSRRRVAAAASFALLTACGVVAVSRYDVQAVMGQMSSGFEYDDSLGRLQFVSNILPDSAMVFLQTEENYASFRAPLTSGMVHAWNENEPWIEYDSYDNVRSSADGEVMNVVESRAGEYTVRIRHSNGYETICSGLCDVSVREGDVVYSGQEIGKGAGKPAYELRNEGISVCPEFATEQGTDDAR